MTAIAPSSLLITTTTTATKAMMPALAKATTISSIPVRAIPVPNTNKLILAGPCIVLRTATVAEQMQALRQERKVIATTSINATITPAPAAAAATPSSATSIKSEPQSPEPLRCKRRADLVKLGFPEAKPISVSRRNARERNRVKLVNQGFETLREHVPNGRKNRKMSKVDTLRSAVDYIRQMQELIREHDKQTGRSPGPEQCENIADENEANNNIVCTEKVPDHGLSVVNSVCNANDASVLCTDSMTSTTAESPLLSDINVVDNAPTTVSEKMILDNIINNNNNKFVNFNEDNNNEVDMLQSVNTLNNVQEVDSEQLANCMQQVILNNGQQLTNLNSLNASAFIDSSSFVTSSTSSSPLLTTTTSSSRSPTITVITLPLVQAFPQSPSSSDDVFLTDSQQRILTSSSTSTLGTMTLGTLSTLTTLQGMGSLSGQRFTITQPRQRHLSFSEPETDQRMIQLNVLRADPTPLSTEQQQLSQQHISFTLLPAPSAASLPLLSASDSSTLTLVPQPVAMEHEPSLPQQQAEQPQFTTLTNLTLPEQSVNSVLSLDQAVAACNTRPLADEHGHTYPHSQTLVAQNNAAMLHAQRQVDQVPSPSLSTASSHTSESSYESYESLGSLEEDLQDISDWLTELCKSTQDNQNPGQVDDKGDLLVFDEKNI